jgi:hypothetical protein
VRLTAVVTATPAAGGNATPAPAQSPTPAPAQSPTPAQSSSTPATGAATTPSTGTGTATAGDLSVLPDSQISSSACATLVGGGGFRRIDLPATGAVRMRVRADATVVVSSPVVVTVTAARPAGLRSVRYTLDGRAVRAAAGSPAASASSRRPAAASSRSRRRGAARRPG